MSLSFVERAGAIELSVALPGGTRPIHPLWLRERSPHPEALDARTLQRFFNPSELQADLAIIAVEERGCGRLRVRFSDGHDTIYDTAEILAEAAMTPDSDGAPERVRWDGTLAALPTAWWRDTVEPAALGRVCGDLLRFGFVLLRGVPSEPGQVLTVAHRFGFVRDTNFGALFNVRSEPEASDLAYTSLALEPHTDNPYREPVPGVQLLHCLVNETQGGLSTLVDGLAVAEALKARDPTAYDVLTRVPVRFRYVDLKTELIAWQKMIDADAAGRVRWVHVSPRLDLAPLLPPAEMESFYRARRVFDAMLKSAEFEIRFRLDSGDLVMFDNRRLLHGRTGFDPSEGLRHLQGCYIDLDAPASLYRVLRRQGGTRQAAE